MNKFEPTETGVLDEIEMEIVGVAKTIPERALAERWGTTTKSWSEALLAALCDLGHERHLFICSNYRKPHHEGHGQWMFDLAWLKNGVHGITDAVLILESELSATSDQHIDHDFQKLLLGRAAHRVMVFYCLDVVSQFKRLIEQIREFGRTQPGDRYLLLGFEKGPDQLKYRVFVA
jgi:hypothetical protein